MNLIDRVDDVVFGGLAFKNHDQLIIKEKRNRHSKIAIPPPPPSFDLRESAAELGRVFRAFILSNNYHCWSVTLIEQCISVCGVKKKWKKRNCHLPKKKKTVSRVV